MCILLDAYIENATQRVCQIKFLVAYGEKSFKSIQIIQIFFLFVICLIYNDFEIYFPSLRE